MNCENIITDIAVVFESIATIVVAWIAYKQLPGFVKAQQQANMGIVIEIEALLLEARRDMETAARELRDSEPHRFEESLAKFQSKEESYLNVLDRMCSAMVHDLVPYKGFSRDYYNMVTKAVERWPDRIGSGDSQYHHIADVYENENKYNPMLAGKSKKGKG